MKLNFKHNGSGVLNAIQRAINELAQWRDVQQDRDVDAAMGRTDMKLRDALQDIRLLQEGTMPQAPAAGVFIVTCVNGAAEVVSVNAFPTLAEAQGHMRATFDEERSDAEASGYDEFEEEDLREDGADLAYGLDPANEYHWQVVETALRP